MATPAGIVHAAPKSKAALTRTNVTSTPTPSWPNSARSRPASMIAARATAYAMAARNAPAKDRSSHVFDQLLRCFCDPGVAGPLAKRTDIRSESAETAFLRTRDRIRECLTNSKNHDLGDSLLSTCSILNFSPQAMTGRHTS